jgi:hypothetical protein
METTSIKNVHSDYAGWQNALGFYKDELHVFTHRLTEIAGKNTGKETMRMVEHFENQFIVQRENIDILHHDINEHLNGMATEMQQHAGHISSEQLSTNRVLQDRFESETKIYNGLKEEFTSFLEKLM